MLAFTENKKPKKRVEKAKAKNLLPDSPQSSPSGSDDEGGFIGQKM